MAKRVDPLKAKQAKQKKVAIGLCVFFAIVLFIQVPRTMKMLKGPQATTTAAPAAVTAAVPAAVTPAVPAPGTSGEGIPVPAAPGTPTAAAAQPAVLVDSDVPAAAGAGQLRSFELFKAKDPFAQQNVSAAPSTSTSEPTKATSPPAPPKPDPGTVIAPASGAAPTASTATPPSTTIAPTPTGTTTAPTAPPASAASATSISVNGAAENVAPEGTFPAADPVFVLVSTAKDGKSARIGVAGGSYADGAATIKLTVGKPLKLRNTADGSEFVLLLNTVAGFVPPKQK